MTGVEIAALALMATAAATAGYSAYQSTAAQHASATYNSKVQRQNAKLAEIQAQDTEARGRMEEDAYRRRLGQMQGQQLTALAGTGVQLGTGSALGLQQELSKAGDLDALSIRLNAQREAYANRLGGTSALAQSRLSSLEASYAQPTRAAALTTVGTAAQYGAQWYGAKAGR